jgi:dienelactone hydrolase
MNHTASTVRSPDIAGQWQSTVEVAGQVLQLSVRIEKSADGYHGTLFGLNAGIQPTPLSDIAVGENFSFKAPPLGIAYAGIWVAEQSQWVGQWSQNGLSLPGVLTRTASSAQLANNRPQTPVKPYPYAEEAVVFVNAAAQVRLAGSLTLPQAGRPFPAVILIAGSGPQTRDQNIFGHRYFLVLADQLTRQGIAVLRYDKRGIGESSGKDPLVTTADYASDAIAAVAYLKTRPDIDSGRIGLLGHSEGGTIAPQVANADRDVSFLVLMAAPGVKGHEIAKAQSQAINRFAGLSEAQIADSAATQDKMLDAVMFAKDQASAETEVRSLLRAAGTPENAIESQVKSICSAWVRHYLLYDPVPALRALRQPVLALIGSNDLQVLPDQNLPALRGALKNNPDATVLELPKLNHLFQTSNTGAPSEYNEIEETIAPIALDLMTRWLKEHTQDPTG